MSKKKKSRFGSNVSKTAEREKNRSKGFTYLNLPKGLEMYKEPFGEIELDVIPYTVTDKHHPDYFEGDPESAVAGDLWYRRPIQVHRNIGADKETVVCPKTVGKKCPICEEKDKQYKDGVPSEDVVGKTSFRSLYYVVPKKHKDYEEEPHVWDISQYCFGDELNETLEEDLDDANFPELDGGKTLSIKFAKKKFGTNDFAFCKRIKFLKRKKAYSESIMKGLPSLDDIFTVRSYKDLQRLFFEMDEEDDVENEDTSSSKEKKRKKKGADSKKEKERPSPDFSEKPEKKKKGKKKEKKK